MTSLRQARGQRRESTCERYPVEDLIIGRAELLGVPTIQSFVRGAAAPAFGLTLTYEIDDYGTHRRRGVRQEVLRIVYLNVSGALQPQEGLMNASDDGRSAHGVALRFIVPAN